MRVGESTGGDGYLCRVQQDTNDGIDKAVKEVLPAATKGFKSIGRPLHCTSEGAAVREVASPIGRRPCHDRQTNPRETANDLQSKLLLRNRSAETTIYCLSSAKKAHTCSKI